MDTHIEPAADSDSELLASWFNHPENNKWLLSLYRLGKYNKITHEMILKKSDNLFYLVYEGNTPIGFVGLCFIDTVNKTATIWYILGDKAYAGQGIMTTAVSLLLEKAFQDLKLHSVQALVAEENFASLRVLEKNNFKRSGIQREAHCINDKFQNRICFDLLSSEYQKMLLTAEAKQIRELIGRIKQTGQGEHVSYTKNLLLSGFLDSFDIIRLVDELEKMFSLKIPGGEITEDNFKSIEAMAALILKIKPGPSTIKNE